MILSKLLAHLHPCWRHHDLAVFGKSLMKPMSVHPCWRHHNLAGVEKRPMNPMSVHHSLHISDSQLGTVNAPPAAIFQLLTSDWASINLSVGLLRCPKIASACSSKALEPLASCILLSASYCSSVSFSLFFCNLNVGDLSAYKSLC